FLYFAQHNSSTNASTSNIWLFGSERKFLRINYAGVAELADAPDLGSGGEIRRGSSPLPGTAQPTSATHKMICRKGLVRMAACSSGGGHRSGGGHIDNSASSASSGKNFL